MGDELRQREMDSLFFPSVQKHSGFPLSFDCDPTNLKPVGYKENNNNIQGVTQLSRKIATERNSMQLEPGLP